VPAPVRAPAPVVQKKPAAPAESESWIDWIASHWWVPGAVIVALVLGLLIAARRRKQSGAGDLNRMAATDVADFRDPTAKLGTMRKGDDSFVVEESGEHPIPEFDDVPDALADTHNLKSADDTMSSESAVNLDQGDPLAEADFHMAYGLYDQAADLVRIALEREPDRRDLRLKLLEIYFVWGNKDAFLQTAKGLEATRDRAPAGEWDKIVIMGKQICPDEPLFASTAGSGRGAGALVDLNLEGGENRVDIDLFGDPEGERSRLDRPLAKEGDDTAATGEMPAMHSATTDLDFTLDTPERGADDSPTRDMDEFRRFSHHGIARPEVERCARPRRREAERGEGRSNRGSVDRRFGPGSRSAHRSAQRYRDAGDDRQRAPRTDRSPVRRADHGGRPR
jgi:pilus assembly protein FimV